MSLTGHFIDDKWERNKLVLSVIEFNESHTGDNIEILLSIKEKIYIYIQIL